MRISDWSSDVCSSDLPWQAAAMRVDLRERRVSDLRVTLPLHQAQPVLDIASRVGLVQRPQMIRSGDPLQYLLRSADRRVGNEFVSPSRSRECPKHTTKTELQPYTTLKKQHTHY